MESNVIEVNTDLHSSEFEYKWKIFKFGMCLDSARFCSSSHIVATSLPFSGDNDDIEWYFELVYIPKEKVAPHLKKQNYLFVRLVRVCKNDAVNHLENRVVIHCGFSNNRYLYHAKLTFHRFQNTNKVSCTKLIPLDNLLRCLNIRSAEDSVLFLCRIRIFGQPFTILVNHNEE
ncbi:hypothetical protein PV325_011347 [Microctonus aethiopoides]|uniref:Uncharacterized protein n=1 Tax=Microctonus aethiopoides TaxID=144406 RepID=A0AA39C4D9_9HYME|nr:hypothetical protein PV325_011347 [Microctonus aethiopoides]KAK0091108.1 hypothetical protein PV326_003720 [Microctonus aethiopoides]KAK0157658.1 hypothetical protein PV328_011369 [Microctonus aethiopoides]